MSPPEYRVYIPDASAESFIEDVPVIYDGQILAEIKTHPRGTIIIDELVSIVQETLGKFPDDTPLSVFDTYYNQHRPHAWREMMSQITPSQQRQVTRGMSLLRNSHRLQTLGEAKKIDWQIHEMGEGEGVVIRDLLVRVFVPQTP